MYYLINLTQSRYERKHSFGKNVARSSNNFKNLVHTIHSRHQMTKAHFEHTNHFVTTNFWCKPARMKSTPLSEIPKHKKKILARNHPYKLKKKVLRAIKGSRSRWFHTTEFYQVDKSTYCEGNIVTLHYSRNSQEGPRTVPERCPATTLQRVNLLKKKQYILYDSLHHSNSFMFTDDNGAHWLIEGTSS